MKTEQIARILQGRDIDRVLVTDTRTGSACSLCNSNTELNYVAHFYHRSERIINGVWKPFSSFTSVAFQHEIESLNRIEGLCPSCEKVLRKGRTT